MPPDRSQFIKRFIEECSENVSRLVEGMLALKGGSDDAEAIDLLFRAAHTIKGSSRMMKLETISKFAHRIEDVLDGLRQGLISHSPELVSILLRGTDEISHHLSRLSAGEELTEVNEDILALMEQAAKGAILESGQMSEAVIEQAKVAPQKATEINDIPQVVEKRETIRVSSAKLDKIINMAGELVNIRSRIHHRVAEVENIEKKSKSYADKYAAFAGGEYNSNFQKDAAAAIVSLYSLIRELKTTVKEDDAVVQALTDELEGRALDLRMVPLESIFSGFHRTVRDMALSLGKNIQLEISGGETELDKKIIDRINDPLIHIIRNCLDHGMESPDERKKVGKSATGTIAIKAQYEGQSVAIEVSDDGAGISVDKLRQKALQKKIYSESQINGLSDSEIIQFIYEPGFTTSEFVTDISGRGVGMDVVRKIVVEELKGIVQTRTEKGQGTTIAIRLPVTMAIMKVLLIGIAGVTFAVPSSRVIEIIRIPSADLIEIGDKIAFRLREQLIPTIALGDIVGSYRKPDKLGKDVIILVVCVGEQTAGIFIDELIEELEMLIKPLPYYLQKNLWASGAIITGRDSIVSVLNIPHIVRTLKEKRAASSIEDVKPQTKQIRILVVDDSISTREIEKSILESHGYEVRLAGDGVEAMESLKKQQFDLIVTDIEMPRMDGFTLTEKIRQEENYKEVPVILVTSRDKEADKKRGLQAGANAYIVKGSFEQDQLLGTIKALTI